MRPADGPSNGSGTLSRIQSLADYTIAMLDLLEMLRALTLYPWLNTAEDDRVRGSKCERPDRPAGAPRADQRHRSNR